MRRDTIICTSSPSATTPIVGLMPVIIDRSHPSLNSPGCWSHVAWYHYSGTYGTEHGGKNYFLTCRHSCCPGTGIGTSVGDFFPRVPPACSGRSSRMPVPMRGRTTSFHCGGMRLPRNKSIAWTDAIWKPRVYGSGRVRKTPASCGSALEKARGISEIISLKWALSTC